MCDCTKIRYFDRKAARLALRQMNGPGIRKGGLRPYRCVCCTFFHLGHLPNVIVHGDMTRDEVYG